MVGTKQILSLRRGLSGKSLTSFICFYAICCLIFSILFVLNFGQHVWLQQQQSSVQYAELREKFTAGNAYQMNVLRGKSSSVAAVTDITGNDRTGSPLAIGTPSSKVQSLDADIVTTTKPPTIAVTAALIDKIRNDLTGSPAADATPSSKVVQSLDSDNVTTTEPPTTAAIVPQNNIQIVQTGKKSLKVLSSSKTITAALPQNVKSGQSAAINESFDQIFAQQQQLRIARDEARIKAMQALQERREKQRKLAEEKRRVAAMIKSLNVTGIRALVEVLLKRFDDDEIVSVRGFYSSGTNWLRSLLLHNCKNMTFERSMHPPLESDSKLDADAVFGWKHGLFLEREITRLASRKRRKLVIISREAPTWAVSAWKMYAMANVPGARKSPSLSQPNTGKVATGAFGNFSRYINDHKVKETSIYSRYLEMYYDTGYRQQYRIEGENVFEARTKVYRNWMTLLQNTSISNQVYFMRYEDLLDDSYTIFRQLIQHLNVSKCTVTSPETFDPVSSYVKYHVEHKRTSFKGRHPRKEFCVTIKSQAIYDSILAKIDRVFEAQVLGYTYPAKLEEYCRGVMQPEEQLQSKQPITAKKTTVVNKQNQQQQVDHN